MALGRPKKIQDGTTPLEVKEEVKPAISDIEIATQNKAILDANDSDKKKKDVMLMNIKELENHLEYLNKRIGEVNSEYENRRKLVDGINGSIAGAQAELSNIKANTSAQNSKLIVELNSKLDEVNKADVTLRKLIKENFDLSTTNKQKESALNEERQICLSQVVEMKNALAQNNTEWHKREADILAREASLKQEKVAFEEEKASLAPEAARITSIKNENLLLVQKIEQLSANNKNVSLGIGSERQRLEEEKLVEQNRLAQSQLKLANEEKRLRDWEQNLKDFDLETRAKAAKADKLIRQAQMEKELNSK